MKNRSTVTTPPTLANLSDRLQATECALETLRLARTHAQRAGSPRLLAAIRRALKSADGARRHHLGRLARGGAA